MPVVNARTGMVQSHGRFTVGARVMVDLYIVRDVRLGMAIAHGVIDTAIVHGHLSKTGDGQAAQSKGFPASVGDGGLLTVNIRKYIISS
ncbi:hypothetical protein ES708_14901 [subsurface metagenome]